MYYEEILYHFVAMGYLLCLYIMHVYVSCVFSHDK